MNLCYPLAVYATVCKHLGEPLRFSSDLAAWEVQTDQSSAMLNGYMEEWMVLNDHTANEAFNTADDAAFTWGKFWPKLAGWYGIEYVKPDPDAKYTEIKSGEQTPRGFGPPATFRFTFTYVDWAKQPKVQQAWKEIAAQNGLVEKELRDVERVFSFLDLALVSSTGMNFR
jgi:hypothetical protein